MPKTALKTTENPEKAKKSPKTTKSSPKTTQTTLVADGLGSALADIAVGHRPAASLTPDDESLFRAFQSNLLSLISHELRTPLMGILNSLTMLEDKGAPSSVPESELIAMARRNAQRLEAALAALLDLASIESGTFHARMREVNLARLVEGRLRFNEGFLRDKSLKILLDDKTEDGAAAAAPVLVDPQRLGRALDLCLQGMVPRAEQGSEIKVHIDNHLISFTVKLSAGMEKLWENAWSQAEAGFQSGVLSPGSAFAGVVQSEQAFLTRVEEGLGSELLLVHEVMRLHGGKLTGRTDKQAGASVACLLLELPVLSSIDALRLVLSSRNSSISPEAGAMGSVALGLLQVPEGIDTAAFRLRVKKILFRSTDAAYALPEKKLVAIVLDDCKAENAPGLVERVSRELGLSFKYGLAVSPVDAIDASELVAIAEHRLGKAASVSSGASGGHKP